MKADISDAPERVIRRHHKRGALHVAIYLLIAAVATTGAFQLVNRPSGTGSAFKWPISQIAGEGTLIRQSGMPPTLDIRSPQPQVSSDMRIPDNGSRQTAFNDQNFTPRGADNVITLRGESDLPPRKEPPQKMKLTIVRQSPTMKDRACWPYRQGRIESRNCRASIGLMHRN